MKIFKHYHHRGHIDELSRRYRAFSKLKHARIKKAEHLKWKDTHSNLISHHIQVAFFGKTGYGKSTTVNAFFGKSIMKTSPVSACTRECNSLDFELSPNFFLSLADFPGIGESEYRDKEYLEMYSNFLYLSSTIVYVIRADTRDYSVDISAYRKLFTEHTHKKKVILALNFCDKIEPTIRRYSSEPSPEQMININKKVNSVIDVFCPINKIIPYSAETGWNMNNLAEAIVNITVNDAHIVLF